MGCNSQVRGCQLQQECGSMLGLDLTLMLRHRAHRLTSVLVRGVYRLTLKLKCEASQACICVEMQSYTSSHFNVKTRPWGSRLKEKHDLAFGRDCEIHVWDWNATYAFDKGCEVHLWVETRPRVWHEACVWGWNATSASARFVSKALSLVIFRQPTYRTPFKVFETPQLTRTDFKILWTLCWLGLSWLD